MVPPSSSKRSSKALYNRSAFGSHMNGQSEDWWSSDSYYKRPRYESASYLPIYPQRPGEKDCTHYMLTRTCKFGETCRFDHPIWVPPGGIPDWKEPPSVPFEFHPERPGAPDCPHFLKTQQCKFGLNCKFNHPKDEVDSSGKNKTSALPERPSEPSCSFYMKTGICKFGASCKFNHPKDAQVPSDGNGALTHSDDDSVQAITSTPASSYNSKGLPIRDGEVDCTFYMKTGSCKYGANCRFNHPDFNVVNPVAAVLPSLANFNMGVVSPSILQSLQPGLAQTMYGHAPVMYPQRPGQTECDFYMKTGECKYGEECKYHHPMDRQGLQQNVKLTLAGLPRRKGAQHCPFYMKTGMCSFGVTCKFDHPPPGEVKTSSGNESSSKSEDDKSKKDEENVSEDEDSKGNGDSNLSDSE